MKLSAVGAREVRVVRRTRFAPAQSHLFSLNRYNWCERVFIDMICISRYSDNDYNAATMFATSRSEGLPRKEPKRPREILKDKKLLR
jgi:hypothetical protein